MIGLVTNQLFHQSVFSRKICPDGEPLVLAPFIDSMGPRAQRIYAELTQPQGISDMIQTVVLREERRLAVFGVNLHQSVGAPADDELAKKSNFENLEAMRKAVGERIEQDYGRISRSLIKRQLLDKLAEQHKFAVPEGLVENEFNAIWQRIEEAKKAGQKLEDDEEKMRKEYRDIAERRVRLGLLLADVGRSNSIDVTPEELNQAVMREAMRYPGQERQVIEFYTKNAELKAQLRAPIFEEKTVDFVLELAKVTEKSVTPEELLKAAREAEEDDEEKPSEAATN